MKLLACIITLFITITISFGQKHLDYNKQGDNFFEQENYDEALKMYSKALRKEKKGEIFFQRGVTRFMLKDTCGFCKDMKSAADLFFEKGRYNYKRYCIKYDENAYNNFIKGKTAYFNKNYHQSEYWLTQSINSYKFVDNMYLRGLTRLNVLDSNGFCIDMFRISAYSERANINYSTFCLDTTFYDKSFLKRVNASPYFEVRTNINKGYVFDETKYDDSFASFYYHDSLKVYTLLFDKHQYDYEKQLQDYVNEINIPLSVRRLIGNYYKAKVKVVLTFLVSETGEVIDCVNNRFIYNRFKLTREEHEFLIKTLFELVKPKALEAPRFEPLYIGERPVITEYIVTVNFKI